MTSEHISTTLSSDSPPTQSSDFSTTRSSSSPTTRTDITLLTTSIAISTGPATPTASQHNQVERSSKHTSLLPKVVGGSVAAIVLISIGVSIAVWARVRRNRKRGRQGTDKYCTLQSGVSNRTRVTVSKVPAAWKIVVSDSPVHAGGGYVQ